MGHITGILSVVFIIFGAFSQMLYAHVIIKDPEMGVFKVISKDPVSVKQDAPFGGQSRGGQSRLAQDFVNQDRSSSDNTQSIGFSSEMRENGSKSNVIQIQGIDKHAFDAFIRPHIKSKRPVILKIDSSGRVNPIRGVGLPDGSVEFSPLKDIFQGVADVFGENVLFLSIDVNAGVTGGQQANVQKSTAGIIMKNRQLAQHLIIPAMAKNGGQMRRLPGGKTIVPLPLFLFFHGKHRPGIMPSQMFSTVEDFREVIQSKFFSD